MAAPTDISGLVHRFRASQLTGFTNGASVSSAAFETGGVTLTQATAANQPTFVTNSLNGVAGLRFNGSSTFMTGTVSTAISEPLTIVLVIKAASANTQQEIMYSQNEISITSSGAYSYYSGATAQTGGTVSTGGHALVAVGNTTGNDFLYVDGTQAAAGNAGSGTLDQYRIGSHPAPQYYFNGDVLEIVAYNKALTAADRATLGSYIQSTYAISMSDAASGTASTSRFVRNVDLTSLVVAATGFQNSNIQTSNYTLVRADVGKVVEMNTTAVNTVTIPPNSSVSYPVGAIIDVLQAGIGQTNIVAGAGVTLDALDGTATSSRYATIRLRQRATNEWVVSGSAIGFYDPTTIGGLVYRMRASTIGISTDGTAVASVPFEVGGVTLTASGSAQPTWRARGVNGRPYLSFDGIDDFMSTTSGVPTYNQPVTACVIAQIRNGVTSQELLKIGGIEILLNQSANTWSTYSGNLINSSVYYGGAMSFTGVFGAGGSQGSIEAYTNGVFTASGGGGGNSTGGGDIYIGTHPNTPRFLSADYYEVLVYNQTMSAADLLKLHNYAQANYQFS